MPGLRRAFLFQRCGLKNQIANAHHAADDGQHHGRGGEQIHKAEQETERQPPGHRQPVEDRSARQRGGEHREQQVEGMNVLLEHWPFHQPDARKLPQVAMVPPA